MFDSFHTSSWNISDRNRNTWFGPAFHAGPENGEAADHQRICAGSARFLKTGYQNVRVLERLADLSEFGIVRRLADVLQAFHFWNAGTGGAMVAVAPEADFD